MILRKWLFGAREPESVTKQSRLRKALAETQHSTYSQGFQDGLAFDRRLEEGK